MAIDPTFQSPYFGDAIDIATTGTALRLIDLIHAVDPHISEAVEILNIYAFSANTDDVLIGSDRITADNYAYSLAKGTVKSYLSPGPMQGVPLGRIWIYCTAESTLGIEIVS
jgi:hypothetical protein